MTPLVNRMATPGAAILGAAVAISAQGIFVPLAGRRGSSVVGANVLAETPAFSVESLVMGMPDLEDQTPSFLDDVHVIQAKESWELAMEDGGPLERPDPY